MSIIIEIKNDVLFITLNRPEALNALNFEMILELHSVIDALELDKNLKGAVLYGAGGKAYCAGGDIKLARQMAIEGRIDEAMEFFKAEYDLNKKMFHCSKHLVAIMNGVTMGGGVGISAPCRTRIATTKTLWAMPEVRIGFFPDIGGAYYLSRMPDNYGLFLGMTGERVNNSSHLLGLNIAHHVIDHDRVLEFISTLESFDSIQNHIETFSLDIAAEIPVMGDLSYKNEYAPFSYHIAEQHIRAATTQNFDTVMARDLELARVFLHEPDFIEGVRAMVVDKDQNPKWSGKLNGKTQISIKF